MTPAEQRPAIWLLPAVLLVLVGAWAAWVQLSGRAFLPRHTAARDLPYAFHREGLESEPFNRAMTDPINLLYPDRVFATEQLRDGQVPLWNHAILCGVPHAANPLTATFYPPSFLAMLFEPLDFLLFSAALHVFLAGVLFQTFLLAAGVSPRAAAFGALGFALSGWTAAHLHNTPLVAVVAWIPLGLAGIEWILAGWKKGGTLALAASLALQHLAGFTLFAVIGTLVLAVYAGASLLLRRIPMRDRGRLAIRIFAAAALGLLLASIQLLPTLDARSRAARRGTPRAGLLVEAFEPGVLSGLFLPRWLGEAHEKPVTEDPSDGDSDADHKAREVAARLVLGRESGGVKVVTSINAFGERTLYAGGPIILLALAGLVSIRRRAALALLVCGALATAFALGALPPDLVLAAVGLNVGAPGRAILVLALVLPALAAFGLDRLFDEARPSKAAWAGVRVAALLLGAGGLVVSTLALVRGDSLLEALLEKLRALGAGRVLGAASDVSIQTYAAYVRPAFDRLAHDLLFFSLFVLATWFAVERARRIGRAAGSPSRGLRAASITVLALLVIDLGWFFLTTVRPVSRERLYETSPALDFLYGRAETGRFARVAADRATAFAETDSLLPPNMGMVHHLVDVQGYRELAPARLLELVGDTPARTSPVGFGGFALADAASPVVDLLGARFFVASHPLDESSEAFAKSGLKRVAIGPESRNASGPARDLAIYENPDAQPFAWIVHESAALPDAEAVLALRSGAVDFRKRVILDPAAPAPASTSGAPGPDENVAVRFGPDSIRLDATLSSPGFLVVATCWDPGWRATLWHGPWAQDRGAEQEVLRANAAFMAVRLEAGAQTVDLRYLPTPLTAGAIVSGAALLALLVWTVWPARRARAAAPASPAPPASA